MFISCKPSDEALCKFLPLPIVEKRSILNVAEFLDPPLKTSPVFCKTSLFFYYFELWPPLPKAIVFFSYFLLSSLLDGCYHYLVFVDLVNGSLKSKSLAKEQVSIQNKNNSTMYISFNFWHLSFLLWSIFSPLVNGQLKWLNPLCSAYPRLIFFRVNWWQNI